jgi:putative PIN family toxin of toxin-antitoxin system
MPSVRLRPSRLVLDTNIVLDCLVFRDSATRDLTAAIEARRVQVLVHQHALDELESVLGYPQCHLAVTEQRQVLDRYLTLATLTPMPHGFTRDTLLLPPGFPRCRDRDDAPFLALAYHARGRARHQRQSCPETTKEDAEIRGRYPGSGGATVPSVVIARTENVRGSMQNSFWWLSHGTNGEYPRTLCPAPEVATSGHKWPKVRRRNWI